MSKEIIRSSSVDIFFQFQGDFPIDGLERAKVAQIRVDQFKRGVYGAKNVGKGEEASTGRGVGK